MTKKADSTPPISAPVSEGFFRHVIGRQRCFNGKMEGFILNLDSLRPFLLSISRVRWHFKRCSLIKRKNKGVQCISRELSFKRINMPIRFFRLEHWIHRQFFFFLVPLFCESHGGTDTQVFLLEKKWRKIP